MASNGIIDALSPQQPMQPMQPPEQPGMGAMPQANGYPGWRPQSMTVNFAGRQWTRQPPQGMVNGAYRPMGFMSSPGMWGGNNGWGIGGGQQASQPDFGGIY